MKEDIFSLTGTCLKEKFLPFGMPAFRAKQVHEWLYKKHIWSFTAMSNIGKKDIDLLNEHFTVLPKQIKILKELKSKDGLTTKLLLQFPDGATVETVGMIHDYGNSVCVSSQVGCAMGCVFCASAINGLVRNLTAAEMLAQVAIFQQQFAKTSGRVDNVVVMGSGEPFSNYNEVISFVKLLHDQNVYNISNRSITISTCGIVPGMERLSKENIPVSLAVSLHSADNELRSKLMPINKKYNVEEVFRAANAYAQTSGRQVTYEYLLLAGVNDSSLCAEKLADLLKGTLSSVNVIPFNTVKEKNLNKPDKKQAEKFLDVLKKRRISATIRKEMGADINAACGQLRAQHINKTGEV